LSWEIAMNEDRRQILQMLAEGKITTDEAERLLVALELAGGAPGQALDVSPPGRRAKYLRVMVDAVDKHHSGGPVKVNIRVPMQLLRAGMRLGAMIPTQARDQVNDALHRQGIPFDIDQMKPDDLEAMVDHLNDLTVDVDQDGAKVRVFCE
jgi:hypothetical protein